MITCVDCNLKAEYFEKYLDTFLVQNPQFLIPDSVKVSHSYKSLDYEHLDLAKFYFSKYPVEVYYVQWRGPGCINVRFTYEPLTGNSQGEFIEDSENKIADKEINRIKKRFETEVIPDFEQVILSHELVDSVYLK